MSGDYRPVDARYLKRVERARRMTPQERVSEAAQLTALALQIMTDGARQEMPHASSEELWQLVCQRVKTIRSLGRTS